jgi:hypothetical protein
MGSSESRFLRNAYTLVWPRSPMSGRSGSILMLRFISLGILLLLVVAACGTDDSANDDERATEVAQAVQATLQAVPSPTATDEPVELPTDTPSPTATAMPSSTPTPSATATPSGVDEKTIGACEPVCRGEAVLEAATYVGPGPHPVVLLDTQGSEHPWTNELPREWWPATVEELQLVALIGPEEEVVIEVCPYNGPDITRFRYQHSIRLVEASTGIEVDSAVLTGSDPRECRATEAWSLERLEGERPTYEQVEEWLRPFVTEDAG